MEIRLLGPLEVRDGERTVALPRRQQRALLAALALRAGEVVSTDRLVSDLWGEHAPVSATGSLQNTVSALRKTLGHDVVLTQAPGYRLALAPESVDAHRFERLLADARGADDQVRGPLLSEALGLWRGPALADLDEEQFARIEGGRLDELRVAALEERVDTELALGRHAALVGELETLVAAHPLRERLRGQLMLTLYRCGRQAEALEVYRAARLALADELGLDPSPELQELERRVLRQDPSLAAPAEVLAEPLAEKAERRLVTVLAAVPPADDDPERHRRLLDEALARVRAALGRNGGSLERFGPEGLVAMFGADAPSDDDALRAVATAEELGLPAGIATGEVVGGAGPVVGRAVELARSEGIALDERTQALVAESRRLDRPLVGRRDELAVLRTALEAGSCHVVTVIGEPGIGKTRLARELALRAGEQTTVLVARCQSYGEGGTFVPLLDALQRADPERTLARQDDGELVLHRLAALAGGEESVSLGESFWAVRRLLESLSPALLVLDDVHWAEPALLDLVDYLDERMGGALLVLCLARPEVERALGQTLTLGPLADEEARQLVPPQLEEETTERIVELAEGNALYLEQLASYAAEGGEGLPPTLEAVLAGRLGRLDASERGILQRAAVVGREFSLGAVGALCGGEAARSLLALSRAGFVHPATAADPADDGYTFHHVLLRDAAYSSLTKADRADLHERVAAWLDRDGPGDDALVGYHLEQAVRYRRELGEDAGELAATAGERLASAGMRLWIMNDVGAATGLLDRATTIVPSSSQRAALLWELAITLRLQDRLAEAHDALDQAEQDARAWGAPSVVARVAAERAEIRLLNGDLSLDQAVDEFEAALTTLRGEEDERGLGRAYLLAGSVHWLACNLAAAEAAAERAGEHYHAAGFSPAGCIGTLAEALYHGATPVASATEKCTDLLNKSPDRMTEANLTSVLGGLRALAGNAADARSLLDHARGLYEDLGSSRGLLTVWTPYRIDAEIQAGNLDVATTLARENFEALAALGDVGYASTRAVELAELLLLQGGYDEAERLTVLAERDGLASDVLVQFLRRSLRARLLARSGDLRAALLMGRDAVALASLTDVLRYRARAHLALAEVLAQAGEEPAARSEEALAEDLLRRKGVKGALVGAPST
ncbi:MAG TPA: BTAD domain-containing putative transcriptional regulator [Gaiellaceae bacterium]|nr:BTAD domain-containing putative transcriptional regulator [Gaiellaceae bacterium]